MEDDNTNNEGMRKRLQEIANKLLGKSSKSINVEEMPEAYKECSYVYRAVHDSDGSLAIYLGLNEAKDKLFLGFGTMDPLVLTETEALYLVGGITGLMTKLFEENMGVQDLGPKVNNEMRNAHFSKGFFDPEEAKKAIESGELDEPGAQHSAEEQDELAPLKNLIYGEGEGDEEAEKMDDTSLDELKNSLKEVENMAQEAQEMTKNMSEEEREAYMKEIAEKQEALLAKKAREFERQLMGTMEEEDETVYNYNYFKGIFVKHGQAALKEELAKIPKEERQEIIEKIKTEYTISKQKKDNNEENSH